MSVRVFVLLLTVLSGCVTSDAHRDDPSGWQDLLTCNLDTEAAQATHREFMAWLPTVLRAPPFVDQETIKGFQYNLITGGHLRPRSAFRVFGAEVLGYAVQGTSNRAAWFSAIVAEDRDVLRARFEETEGMTFQYEDEGDFVLAPRRPQFPSARVLPDLELAAPPTAKVILVAPKSQNAPTIVLCTLVAG